VNASTPAFWLDVSPLFPHDDMKIVTAAHTDHEAVRVAVASDHYNVRLSCRMAWCTRLLASVRIVTHVSCPLCVSVLALACSPKVVVVLFNTDKHPEPDQNNTTAVQRSDPQGNAIVDTMTLWVGYRNDTGNMTEASFTISIVAPPPPQDATDTGGVIVLNTTQLPPPQDDASSPASEELDTPRGGASLGSNTSALVPGSTAWKAAQAQEALQNLEDEGQAVIAELLGQRHHHRRRKLLGLDTSPLSDDTYLSSVASDTSTRAAAAAAASAAAACAFATRRVAVRVSQHGSHPLSSPARRVLPSSSESHPRLRSDRHMASDPPTTTTTAQFPSIADVSFSDERATRHAQRVQWCDGSGLLPCFVCSSVLPSARWLVDYPTPPPRSSHIVPLILCVSVAGTRRWLAW